MGNHGETVAKTEPATLAAKAEKMFRRVDRLLRKAEKGDDKVDLRAAAAVARELRGVLEIQAKMEGAIKAASTTINVFNSPDYKEFEALLADALVDFPDAAEAVSRVIAERRQSQPLH